MKTKEFKVGDRVFDIRYGWGTVVKVFYDTTAHPYVVHADFKIYTQPDCKPVSDYYTLDGRELAYSRQPLLSHEEYTLQPKERVVLVSNDEIEWKERVAIARLRGKILTWSNIKELKDTLGYADNVVFWKHVKELPEEETVELTIKDISEGKGIGIPPHLIRIKE